MTVERVDLAYEPRPHQREAHERRRRFSVLVWHRRSGKTVFSVLELILAGIANDQERARYAYIAPFYRQAKAVAWDYLKHYARRIPGVDIREAELAVRLPNGAEIRLYGADNPDGLRGLYFDGVVLDEVADMRPEVWGEIVRPALTDRLGWALFIGTPKGINLFSDLYHQALAETSADWYADLRRAGDTGALPADELERARHEMSPAQWAQEMDCDFGAAVENAVVPLDLVLEAVRRDVHPSVIEADARVMGVDVAGDAVGRDRSVVARRQGRVVFPCAAFRGLNTMELVSQVARITSEWNADAIFIDQTGIGQGVSDRLRQLGYPAFGVHFGSKPTDPRFENKRAEMWWSLAEWMPGGCLPNDQELIRELTAPTYTYSNVRGKVQVEPKDEIVKRLRCSPDKADALALTFADPVMKRSLMDHGIPVRARGWTTAHEPTWAEKQQERRP